MFNNSIYIIKPDIFYNNWAKRALKHPNVYLAIIKTVGHGFELWTVC